MASLNIMKRPKLFRLLVWIGVLSKGYFRITIGKFTVITPTIIDERWFDYFSNRYIMDCWEVA